MAAKLVITLILIIMIRGSVDVLAEFIIQLIGFEFRRIGKQSIWV